jgi:hypothetical protein
MVACEGGAVQESRTYGGQANDTRPQSVGAPGLAALTVGSSEDTGFSPSLEATVGDAPSVPGSSDIVDLGNAELWLPGFPRLPLLPTDWGQMVGGTELACL